MGEHEDWTAILDQMTAGLRDVGRTSAALYHGLVEGGVPARYAAIAIGQHVASLVLGNGDQDDDA